MDYKTIASPVRAEFTEKRSKFIASLSPIESETEAADFINKVKSEHYDARHNVFAYVIKDGAERFSDDGEPQGTAGMPTLENIRRRGLVNVAVVVTRYFGGILLGAPRLLRAYNHTAALAFDAAKILVMRRCDILKLVCPYDFYARAEILVRSCSGTIQKRDFTENVTLEIVMPEGLTENFSKQLTELSGGSLAADTIDNIYIKEKQ